MKLNLCLQPYNFETGEHLVEKAEGNGKRRYLQGVSSGTKLDGHQERMTTNAIKSFMEQANSGNILLYPDIHGIKSSEDIGILTAAKVLENGDWWTEYRLYDDQDGVDTASKERADKIWKQLKGLPPYGAPLPRGFSIEGNIPDDGLLSFEKDDKGNISQRVIDKVDLSGAGVVLVPRPAYQTSVAHAIYKALGELHPDFRAEVKKSIAGRLKEKLAEKDLSNQYFKRRYDLQDALDEEIKTILNGKPETAKEKLGIAFGEYSELMIELLLQSVALFQDGEGERGEEVSEPYGAAKSTVTKSAILKSLLGEVEKLEQRIGKR